MSKLELAKGIIKDNIDHARCGIFDCRNLVGDPMCNLYSSDGLTIDICYNYEYFEVFGLTDDEFGELYRYYDDMVDTNVRR